MSPAKQIHPPDQAISRRELLKALTALGGALAASSLLPAKWSRPEVGVGVLPAHAQSSCTAGSLEVIATTTTRINGQFVDFDLRVYTPDGTRVTNNNRGPHQGVTHGGPNSPNDDNGPAIALDTERASMPPGQAVNGVYRIEIDSDETIPIEVSVTLIVEGCRTYFYRLNLAADGVVDVATVTYPGGTVAALKSRAKAGSDND